MAIKEKLVLIANRIPEGDRWRLVEDEPSGHIHPTLTDALEAYFHVTGFKGSYRLDPLDSKLYAIYVEELPEEEPKVFSMYGEKFKQGI